MTQAARHSAEYADQGKARLLPLAHDLERVSPLADDSAAKHDCVHAVIRQAAPPPRLDPEYCQVVCFGSLKPLVAYHSARLLLYTRRGG